MTDQTRATPRQEKAASTRRRILNVAVQEFSLKHYDDVAVADIATAADVAHGTPFHYFKSKRGLYLAAMKEAAHDWESSLQGDPSLPPGARMRQMYANQLLYLSSHKGLATRLALGGQGADPEAWQHFEAGRWRLIEWACISLGLNPNSAALRMMMRASTAAVDRAAAFWDEHDQPFDVTLLTDVLFEQTIEALRGAARLDPSLDVERAIQLLRD